MSTCDLCNRPTRPDSPRLTAGEVKAAVRGGLRPPAGIGDLATAMGLSRSEMERGWVDMVMEGSSDWLLCADCAAMAAPYRLLSATPPGPPSVPDTAAPAAPPRLPPPVAEPPFAEARALLRSTRGHAFDAPGPLFNEARRAVMTTWFDGVDRNLSDAQRGATDGVDGGGSPMSRQQLAAAVGRMCDEYEKVLTRVGEVCGDRVRAEVQQLIASVRRDARRLIETPVSEATPSPPPPAAAVPRTPTSTPSPTPRPAPADPRAAAPSPTPADVAAAIATILRGLASQSVIPPKAVPLVQVLERRVSALTAAARVFGAITLGVAIVVASVAGQSAGIGAGIGAFVGALVVLLVVASLAERVWVRVSIGRLASGFGVPSPDGIALFRQIGIERNLMRRLGELIKGIDGQALASDLTKRITEALLLAFIQTLTEPVLTPARDVAEKMAKWRPAKESADAAKSTYSPVIAKCRTFVYTVQQVLENRERLFATLDRVAAVVKPAPGGRA